MSDGRSAHPTPWYRRQFAIIAALVLFAPVGIPLAWLTSGWRRNTKVIASVLSGCLFTVAVVRGVVMHDYGKPGAGVVAPVPPTQAKSRPDPVPHQSPAATELKKPPTELTGAALAEEEPRMLVSVNLDGFTLSKVEHQPGRTDVKALYETQTGSIGSISYLFDKRPTPLPSPDANSVVTKVGVHDAVISDADKARLVTVQWRSGDWSFLAGVQYRKPADRAKAHSAALKIAPALAAWSDSYLDAAGVAGLQSRDDHIADIERKYIGTTFTLGKFTYKVTGMEAIQNISGNGGYVSENAGPGAVFLIVRYEITNLGNETATALADDFELVDSQGRKFRPSSHATTAYIMAGGDKDLAITQLQPGVMKPSIQIFEVPQTEVKVGPHGTRLRIPEKGFGSSGEAWVVLLTRDGKQSIGQ